jgi:hypothetical protein
MSSVTPLGILPNVTSQRHFMDTLSSMMYSELTEKEEEEEGGLETRGRNRDLKSYLIESNEAGLPERFEMGSYVGTVQPTDVSHVKILTFKEENMEPHYSFYVDQSDERFWILHTGAIAEKTHSIIKKFVSQRKFQLDRAWIPKHFLNKMASLPGNRFDGLDTDFSDYFHRDSNLPQDTLHLGAHGQFAQQAKNVIESNEAGLQRAIAYDSFRITRGQSDGEEPVFSSDDLTYEGLLSVKSGKSIDHHISLVDATKSQYRELIEETENFQLRTKKVGDASRIEGKSIDIYFERKIEDFNVFLGRLLDSKLPFRLWGIHQKIASDYYRVFALDLHSGHPLDLEVAPNLIRVYLPHGSCGNSVLRLYVNLQHYYDSRATSEEINS